MAVDPPLTDSDLTILHALTDDLTPVQIAAQTGLSTRLVPPLESRTPPLVERDVVDGRKIWRLTLDGQQLLGLL